MAARIQPEFTDTTQLIEIEELRIKKKLARSIFSGVCSAEGWKPGKKVSEELFDAAVVRFAGTPMGQQADAGKGAVC